MDFRDPVSIPQPKTYDEFERLCLLIARVRYGPEFYRYARSGQAQHGIDIYSAYYCGRCLQSKMHNKDINDAKLINEIKNELLKAKKKFNDLKQFIFAVSVETRPTVQDVCRELSNREVQVIPWFWNQLQEDIASSKWLLRYCFNYEAGAQWITDDFVEKEEKRGKEEGWQPLQFYSSNLNVQWYGLLKNWDAPRQHYEEIKNVIANSFAHSYSDMPVAAVVRGEGGSGKSILLRRLALDLRAEYTIYWIADNSADFLQNEWLYDIENHPTEKYLLVLEDWYRNFTSTGDRATANRLLQKVKQRPNVRLLIGDRPAQFTYYPKTDDIIFDLKSDENASLISFIIDIVPDWKNKFLEKEKAELLKTGFFQVLFVYQYLDTSKPLPKAGTYFLDIVQSDYRHLVNSELPFYKGLAQSLYVFSHLYSEFGLHLSPESLSLLAECYSDSQRPFAIKHDIRAILDDPVMSRYIDVVEKFSSVDISFYRIKFLHDTLADQGWKYAPVDTHNVFGNSASIAQIIDALKTEETAYDLSALLSRILKAKPELLTKEQVLSCCNYLISIGCLSPFYVSSLFTEGLIKMSDSERIDCLQRLIGVGNLKDPFWNRIVIWMKRRMDDKDCQETLLKLIEAGNECNSVLTKYFYSLNDDELKKISRYYFTVEILKEGRFLPSLGVFFNRLRNDDWVRSISCKYLQSPEPEKTIHSFCACLSILKDEKVAKEAARKYLQSLDPEKTVVSFCSCLSILKDEKVAKEAARKYLQSLEPEKTIQSFCSCLNILKDEKVAKEAARKYLQSPEPEKTIHSFCACLSILKDEKVAKEAARKYLQSLEPEKTVESFCSCLSILKDEKVAKEAARKYLQSLEPEKTVESFCACLSILKDEKVAKEAARKYLQSLEPEKTIQSFCSCLNILKDEKVAKEAARKYLQSLEPEKTVESFCSCLNILKDGKVAKEAARKYLQSLEPEKTVESFCTCLNILKDEEVAKDLATHILVSPITGQKHSCIYRALCIAAETEELDIASETMVCRILEAKPKHFNKAAARQYHLYLQLMKVPLFRIKQWQSEVDTLLRDVERIHRNLFYSLTLSHIEIPAPLAEACLFYVRNWRNEFKGQRKFWGYFIRSLAHPNIAEQSDIKEEITELCSQMFQDKNCPSETKGWLRTIAEENKFPLWKIDEDIDT